MLLPAGACDHNRDVDGGGCDAEDAPNEPFDDDDSKDGDDDPIVALPLCPSP